MKYKLLESSSCLVNDEQESKELEDNDECDECETELSDSDDDPEKIYLECKALVDRLAVCENDMVYTRIGCALEQVLMATKAYILYLQGDIEESRQVGY